MMKKNTTRLSEKRRDVSVERLKRLIETEKVVLFIGAGVNSPELVPGWGGLLSSLGEDAEKTSGLGVRLREGLATLDVYGRADVIKRCVGEHYVPLLQRYLYRNYATLGPSVEKFYSWLSEGETGGKPPGCPYVVPIAALSSVTDRVHAVVTYNYDNYLKSAIEAITNLADKEFPKSVLSKHLCKRSLRVLDLDPLQPSSPALVLEPGTRLIKIYHAHGYISPPGTFRRKNDEVVFSQDEYFRVMNEPLSWQTVNQLYFLMNYPCIFLGCSLTDLNMLRLVSQASQFGAERRIFNVTTVQGLEGRRRSESYRVRAMAQEDAGIEVVIAGFKHECAFNLVVSLVRDYARRVRIDAE